MRDEAFWRAVAADIGQASGAAFHPERPESRGGGCINSAYLLRDGSRAFFVKTNRAALLDMFEAESEGLEEMLAADAIRVPRPLCHGSHGDSAYLAMEYLELGGRGDAGRMGEQLAAMHRREAPRFGWKRDNTIGSTPQLNDWEDDWPAFFAKKRIGYQLDLAARGGHRGGTLDRGWRLVENMGAFFSAYRPVASLLHGDLWSGNAAFSRSGEPLIYDPAVYFGDRESDLAMTELFGGFSADFHAGYRVAWPLDPGYATRKNLYQLYHILNHLNLFGGGYRGQAESLISRLLSDT